ncbi:4-hydroxy-tetrahydrodipicolinate synthase [Fulvia fulva]|nr:4-hydroxy-tetrahydrodipicolinate synthase [Fulvia fulva]KAK4620408.1 4-hydroxy-tetrahydrodipicolinate synthase [Fulvia fulva]WPV16931.1 4-hydroxy-tetrahydrodipicolinate synthase [Fulvia fulva]WPV31912.1 4-hydroxy-tetrahydrodipicolinate synthase [Fulvia fulva]
MSPPTQALTGILVAIITPFTPGNKSIDTASLSHHINRFMSAGVHGLVPGGSTGEFTVLSIAERKQLIEQCVKSAAGRVPVVAGIGDLSTESTVDLAKHAAQAGAAAAMVVPPSYDALDYEQLQEFLGEVHRESGLPIMYYNIPSASGIAGLSKARVKYMKDTSGNAPDLTDVLFTKHESITTFNGWDTLTFYGLAAGAKGSVWGATNIIPELSVALWNAVAVEGDLKKGREIWTKVFPVCRTPEEGNYAGAIKTGMELRGWKTGGLRKPFDLLKGEQRRKLAGVLRDAGVEVSE